MAHKYEYYRRLITTEYRNSVRLTKWHKHLLTCKLSEYTSDTVGETMKSITYSSEAGVGFTNKDTEIDYPTIGVTFRHDGDSITLARDTSEVENTAQKLIDAFELDEAVGTQLDILGRIVGIERMLNFQPTSGSALMDDDNYRLCIKAKIIKNTWRGNAQDLYDAWNILFPGTKIFEIQDLQDMSFNVFISGDFDDLQKEIINHGYIIPKPEGVRINLLTITDLTGLPLFAYDYDTLYLSGYGSHWAADQQEV